VRFLLDNDVPDVVARVLTQAGHDVLLLRNVMPERSSDSVVFDYAAANALLLITCNRDDFIPLAQTQVSLRLDRLDQAPVSYCGMRQSLAPAGFRRRIRSRT
jgi:hypothetical protein